MIEFIRDNLSGKWQIIEVNTRPWLFNDFFRRNGLPFIGAAVCEHFDFYNKTNLLDDLIGDHSLLFPNYQLVGKNGACHIDLPRVIDYLVSGNSTKQISSNDVITHLWKYGRNISFAHGDANDQAPLFSAIKEACTKHGLDASKLQNFVMQLEENKCFPHREF